MKTSLVLHGWEGDSKNNWFPWLSDKLKARIYDIYIPNLPASDNPIIEEQLDCINVYSSDFNAGGNIIGHSLGCQLALKFIEENSIRNSNVILVAPSYPGLALELGHKILGDSYDIISVYYDTILNFNKLNGLNNKYTIFLSYDDPYINIENAKKYFGKLKGVNFLDFKNKGHFGSDAKVFELPEILEYVE